MFKKLFLPVVTAICLILMFLVNNFPVFYNYSKNLEVYGKDKSSGEIINTLNFSAIFISKYGEAFSLTKSNFTLNNFLNDFNAELIFTEEVENGTCYYAYSPKIQYLEKIYGQNINIHIFIGKNNVKIGSPLIYGGY